MRCSSAARDVGGAPAVPIGGAAVFNSRLRCVSRQFATPTITATAPMMTHGTRDDGWKKRRTV
jgi:hypothetical protein